MGVFWSCALSVAAVCLFSFIFDDGPTKSDFLWGVGFGLVYWLESTLSDIKDDLDEIKNDLEELKDKASVSETYDYDDYDDI